MCLFLFIFCFFVVVIIYPCISLAVNMAEGETSDDLQTLIRPDDLEGITEESTGSAATHSAPSLLHDPPPAWQLPVQCVLLVLVTTALVIILPVYLEVGI